MNEQKLTLMLTVFNFIVSVSLLGTITKKNASITLTPASDELNMGTLIMLGVVCYYVAKWMAKKVI